VYTRGLTRTTAQYSWFEQYAREGDKNGQEPPDKFSVSKNPRQPSDPRPSATTALSCSLSPRDPAVEQKYCTPSAQKPAKGSDYRRRNAVIRGGRGGGLSSYFSISPETPRADIKNNCDRVTENQYTI